MNKEEFKRNIDLYLDGELDSADTLRFQELAETDPGCRSLLKRAETLRLRVREELSRERASDLLRARIQRDIRREGSSRMVVWRAAAAVLLAVLIGGGIYYQYDQRDFSKIVASSVASHRIYSSGDGELAEFRAKDEGEMLPRLQKRVQFALALPSLTRGDLDMVGGRICLLVDRKSVLLFYQKARERFSLFVTDQKGFRLPQWGGRQVGGRTVYFQESGGYRVAVWKDGECVYSLVAPVGHEGALERHLTVGFKEIVASSR